MAAWVHHREREREREMERKREKTHDERNKWYPHTCLLVCAYVFVCLYGHGYLSHVEALILVCVQEPMTASPEAIWAHCCEVFGVCSHAEASGRSQGFALAMGDDSGTSKYYG